LRFSLNMFVVGVSFYYDTLVKFSELRQVKNLSYLLPQVTLR
jgi:hypothetical protein